MPKPGFLSHRKFLKLVAVIRPHVPAGANPEAVALGHYEFLASTQHVAGSPLIGDSNDLEAVSRWYGAAGEWTNALLRCGTGADGAGLIEEVEPGSGLYQLHDYWDHAPDFVKKRDKRHAVAAALAAAEEARAQERAEGDAEEADAEPPAPPEPPVEGIVFPCLPGKKKQPAEWPLTRAFVDEQLEVFPGVPETVILEQCRLALGWVRTHQRKTYKGMPAFLNGWLGRNINRGAGGQRGGHGGAGGEQPQRRAPFHREIK